MMLGPQITLQLHTKFLLQFSVIRFWIKITEFIWEEFYSSSFMPSRYWWASSNSIFTERRRQFTRQELHRETLLRLLRSPTLVFLHSRKVKLLLSNHTLTEECCAWCYVSTSSTGGLVLLQTDNPITRWVSHMNVIVITPYSDESFQKLIVSSYYAISGRPNEGHSISEIIFMINRNVMLIARLLTGPW